MSQATVPLASERQELSCFNLVSVLRHLETTVGKEALAAVVEPLGLPLPFLRDTRNWVSFEYFNALLDKLVEVTGDEMSPYRAAFSVRPEVAWDFVLYAAYATLWSGSPRAGYAIILGSSFHKRWTKIGDFRLLDIRTTSLRVELALKKGYTQTRRNCLAVQGVLASVPLGMGLPAAEVREVQCAAQGAASCVYDVQWRNRTNWFQLIALPVLALLVAAEIFLFRGVFSAKDVALTIVSFAALVFLAQSLQFRKSLRFEERVNQERSEHLVATMRRMEHDYEQMLETKARLEERTRYLSILNEVASLIARETTTSGLLRSAVGLLVERVGFRRGDYFRLDTPSGLYRPLGGDGAPVTVAEYARVPADATHVPRELIEGGSLPALRVWAGEMDEGSSIHLARVTAPEATTGFFCFLSGPGRSSSDELVVSVLGNVSRQVAIASSRMAARSAIDGILAGIPAQVLIFHRQSLVVSYANRRFLASLPTGGYPGRGSVLGSPLGSVLSFPETTIETIRRLAQELEPGARTEVLEATSGSAVYELSVFHMPRAHQDDELAGLIISDISDAKYFQSNLLINQKLLALGRVASGIAHEINNPLYAVLANAEELAEDPGATPESRALAAEIVEHVVTVSGVIKDLSNYSKTLRREERIEVDLNAVIEESLKLVRYGSDLMGVTLVRELEPLPKVMAGRGEMQQVFINILNNAIQAMGGNGTITLRSWVTGGTITVSITDTGPGIGAEDLPRIFDLFYTTKKPGEGTGQGLYIVRKILELNGGSIRVETPVGGGATFRIELPVGGVSA